MHDKRVDAGSDDGIGEQVERLLDILLVDASMGRIGEENAEACIAFIFRQLHQHMQRQVRWPEDERPRG